MKYVGFPITVSDAIESVKSNSKIILVNKGGKGAIREMAEIILKKYLSMNSEIPSSNCRNRL